MGLPDRADPVYPEICRCVCACVCKCVQVCANVCKCVQMCASVCKCVQVCASVCQCVQVCASVQVCVHVCVHVCMCDVESPSPSSFHAHRVPITVIKPVEASTLETGEYGLALGDVTTPLRLQSATIHRQYVPGYRSVCSGEL